MTLGPLQAPAWRGSLFEIGRLACAVRRPRANTMTTPTVPTDLLGAVNQLLRAALLSPITSLLNVNLNADAEAALDAINAAAVQLQARPAGWSFNTDEERTIDPGEDGSITLPSNTASVKCVGRKWYRRLKQRGSRLYDSKTGSFDIGEPVTVRLVVILPYEDLPLGARMAVIGKAMKEFAVPKNPTPTTARAAENFEAEGMALLEQADAEASNVTLPEVNPHFNSLRRR